MTSSLTRFVVRRVLAAALLVFTVGLSSLVLVRCAPGDPLPINLTPQQRQIELERLGYNRSVIDLAATWTTNLLRLDLGQSTSKRVPVRDIVVDAARRTAEIALAALVLACVIGLTLGTITGAWPRGWVAAVVTPISIALVSCPAIVVAFALLLVAASTRALSISSPLLPIAALALPLGAILERIQSQATSDALSAPDLIATAARGVPRWRLLWIHAFRQSVTPLLGVFGVLVGGLFSGSLAVEWVMSWPGLGRRMYDALVARDMPLVAGCALAGAVLIALGNLAADIGRAIADPRSRETM